MANAPKVVTLLHLLTDHERAQLRERLVPGRFARLRTLLAELLRREQAPTSAEEKSELYRQLFAETYTPDKDFRLRNEYRLLTQHLEAVLVHSAAEAELDPDGATYRIHLLRTLQRRRAEELFEREFTAAYDWAVAQRDYATAHRLTTLRLEQLGEEGAPAGREAAQLAQLNELGRLHLSAAYLGDLRQYQLLNQAAQAPLQPYAAEVGYVAAPAAGTDSPATADYADYLTLKAGSYLLPPAARVAVLKRCLELADRLLAQDADRYASEVTFAQLALARAHAALGHYTEAAPYYDQFLARYPHTTDLTYLRTVAESVATALHLDRLDRATDLLATHQATAVDFPSLRLRWHCLVVASLALRGDAAGLGQLLAEPPPARDQRTKHFFRFYYAILAHLEGRADDAYRELENLRHATAATQDEVGSIHPIVNLFHRYFYAALNRSGGETSRPKLSPLARDTTAFVVAAPPYLRTYLPLLWLRRQIPDAPAAL